MNFKYKLHHNNNKQSNLSNQNSSSNSEAFYSQIQQYTIENPILCILCIFQRGNSKEHSFGISHTKIIPSSLQNITIYSGDYPLHSLNSFPLFVSSIQPDIILTHISSSLLETISSCLDSSIKSRIKAIPQMNINFNTIQTTLHDYYQSHNSLNLNQVCIYTKVIDILSGISFAAQSALYTLFTLTLKSISNTNNSSSNILSCIINFDKLYINDVMFVSYKTQKELKIFEEKLHPSLVKGQGKSKEGLSLYNMFNKCITPQGKKLLKHFFIFPLQKATEIEQRYNCIDDIIKMKNYSFIKSICKELTNIKDLEVILSDLQKFMITFKIWNNIYVSLNSILRIFDMFKTKTYPISLLDNVYSSINVSNISKVFDFICNCLEFNKDDIKPRIKNGVNEMLDKLKEEYKGIDDVLSKLALEYSQKLSQGSCFDKFMYVFIPQLGYMLAVEKNKRYYKEVVKVYQMICEQNGMKAKEELHSQMEREGNVNEVDVNYLHVHNISGNCFDSSNSGSRNNNSSSGNNNINDISSSTITQQKKYEMGEIIEEEENIASPKSLKYLHNNNNNTNTNDMNLSFKKEHMSDDDEDIPDLQNYEETLALQQMTFTNLNIQFQFHSSEMIYFKNEITNSLDRDYGDLSARITDIENAIFREISKQILEFETDIKATNTFISYLDIFINFFILIEKYSLYKPTLTSSLPQQPLFSFTEGRNLLTEIANDSQYIRNSLSSSKSIFIISGNISSGKSVLLRMIGMFVYLAQIGCYVPAKQFEFEPFHKLLTNIDIIESSIEHISGFTIELREIKEIVDILTNDYSLSNTNDANVMVLLDNPFKRSSIYNQKCLLGGFIKYVIQLIRNANENEIRNKQCKVFITVTNEMKEFLISNCNIIDWNVVDMFEMKTKEEKDNVFINTYMLKRVDESEIANNDMNYKNGSRLFLARDNGLDNVLFLRSLEIYNVISNKEKIFMNVEKLHRIANNFAANVNKINTAVKQYCELQMKRKENRDINESEIDFNKDLGTQRNKESNNNSDVVQMNDFQYELGLIDALNKVFA